MELFKGLKMLRTDSPSLLMKLTGISQTLKTLGLNVQTLSLMAVELVTYSESKMETNLRMEREFSGSRLTEM